MLTNQQIATTGLLDLFYYDDTIMDNFSVPDGIDRQLALDTIYQRCGLTPLYHPDPAWLKFYIGRWCSKNAKTWEELYKTTILFTTTIGLRRQRTPAAGRVHYRRIPAATPSRTAILALPTPAATTVNTLYQPITPIPMSLDIKTRRVGRIHNPVSQAIALM